MFQSLGTERNRLSILVQKSKTKGCQHTRSAVVGGTSADTHNKVPASTAHRILNDLAHTVGRGLHGIPLVRRHKSDACRRRHFDYSSAFVFQNTVGGIYRSGQRAGNGHFHNGSVHTGRKCFHRSFSAVSQGTYKDFRLFIGQQYSFLYGISCLQGGQASLERINRNNNIHFSYPQFSTITETPSGIAAIFMSSLFSILLAIFRASSME